MWVRVMRVPARGGRAQKGTKGTDVRGASLLSLLGLATALLTFQAINEGDKSGRTALHLAVRANRVVERGKDGRPIPEKN